MKYLTMCDNCICRPVCKNKKYTDMLYQCSIIQDEILNIPITKLDTIFFRFAILNGDDFFIISSYKPSFINVSVRQDNNNYYSVAAISLDKRENRCDC